ncbi:MULTISPECIES: DUF6746 family protein [Alcanivoracaceae]|uniref:DUF6746 family protein n=1 Tax=Alcanivoracaceae TaxID=224372 RepID=UPI001B881250|nr:MULTISPECIES: DUF6746 family protein [Alcanivoracaceae]MBZ2188428.1 hypothetical protein [Alcanivorax limicola]
MNKVWGMRVVGLVLLVASPAVLADRADHFEGKPADTLADAVANMSEYNKQLAAILAQGALSPQDMHNVHQLTYTLENALAKIRAEVVELADVLEAVHVASETADTDAVLESGAVYLDTARILVP